jgi:hypothetical protein
MRRVAAACLAAIVSCLAFVGGARAQGLQIPCDSFVKNDDGSWSALHGVAIRGTGDSLYIREGSVLRPGAAIRGQDIAAILDQQCPVTPEPAPSAVQPAAPAAPYVALDSFVTAKGTIDASKLTCAEIADASPNEAAQFLTWYSGWYAGLAKKHGVNLAAAHHATLSVVDYCKLNRDKKIVQVMELMLK